MATDDSFLSEDQFQCSICLDVFTEPVSIPCGHNFCKACISQHWKDKELCPCPLCNHKFNKGLKLCVNTAFRDVVENFKKKKEIRTTSDHKLKPGQVACDCCLSDKLKAVKTCLVCLTSFCKMHLEPHQKVDALKTHKLVNPVQKLEKKICNTHNRILELFCRDDQTPICVLCTDHSAHDTVPLEEAYVDKKAQVVKKKPEVQRVTQRHGKKGQKSKVQNKRKGNSEVFSNCMACNQTQQGFPCAHPDQCDIYQFVPFCLAFSEGKFCYGVDLTGGTCWFLGVARETLLRAPHIHADPSNGTWLIMLDNCTCTGFNRIPMSVTLKKRPERVVVCVDYAKGLVSFSDSDTGGCFFSYTGCKFTGPIGLFCAQKESWIQRLKRQVQNVTLKEFIFGFLFMTYLLIVILGESRAQSSAESKPPQRNPNAVKSEHEWYTAWLNHEDP